MTKQANDVMMEKFVFLFNPGPDCPRNFSGKDLKTVNVIVKKMENNFQPLACGEWFHLSFAHFHIISMVDHMEYT